MYLRIMVALVAGAFALLATACGSVGDTGSSGRILEVPGQYASIQDAVDTARSGDVVLVAAGTYNEAVEVTTDGIAIRGVDRSTVVLDGQHSLVNGFTVVSDGVAIENLTVHSYTQNGVVFSSVFAPGGDSGAAYDSNTQPLDGYRVSYVTTYNNGLYGVYAFGSRNGLIEHTYASGHPSSGFYVGQCKPCDVVITDVVAERNAIGYYGTNASGGVYVVRSEFRNNRLGVAPNSQRAELLAPQVETFVVANLIADNDDPLAPAIAEGFFGVGIAVGGGTRNVIERNVVRGHDGVGIHVAPLDGFVPEGNLIRDNDVSGNAIDLGYDSADGAQLGNCFEGNRFVVSQPADIEQVFGCSTGRPSGPVAVALPAAPPDVDYRLVSKPGPQRSRPGPVDGPVGFVGPPRLPTLAALTAPSP